MFKKDNKFNFVVKKSLVKLRSGLENFGRSILVPISIIPLLALIGALGYAIQAIATEVGSYKGNVKVIADGIKNLGMIAIYNIDILIAAGLAAGLARDEKISAALSGLMSVFALYFASNFIIGLVNPTWLSDKTLFKQYGLIERFNTKGFNYNALGGMVAGLTGYYIHKITYQIKFPKALAFFGGSRFSPIASALIAWLIGMILALLWIPVSKGLSSVGKGLGELKAGGAYLYGFTNRLLIPFGLHHVVNYFLYYTQVGATYVDPNGKVIEGIYNVAIAKLSARTFITAQSTWIVNGTFPTNMFSLPGSALAMYLMIPKERRKVGGSIIFAAMLSSFLSGITEPIEFTILFASPYLYAIHTVLTGLTYTLMYVFDFAQVSTRGSGLITWIVVDAINFRIIQNVWGIFVIGPVMFVTYAVIFYYFIKFFDVKTPGRYDTEIKLVTKKDINTKSKQKDEQIDLIMQAYGGYENILVLENCASRLRITMKDPSLFNEELIKKAGSFGTKHLDNQVQAIFGPQVINIAEKLRKEWNLCRGENNNAEKNNS